jgi:spore coat protein A
VLAPADADPTTDVYALTLREAVLELLPGLATPLWTYGGAFPGPTIMARTGRTVRLEATNELPEPAVIHLHGGRVPADSDGYPTDFIPPGGTRTYVYPNQQRGATLWYHDHTLHATAPHVYRGLAGCYLLGDDTDDVLGLPDGDRDVPLVFTDRTFAADGPLIYDGGGHHGFYGDVVLVNGAAQPFFEVAAARYRLRLVNASNARAYDLELQPSAELVQIASDGGLLSGPVRRPSLRLVPGERAEVVVDFAGQGRGGSLTLHDRLGAGDLLRFDVVAAAGGDSPLPDRLREVEPLPVAAVTRSFDLAFDAGRGLWTFRPAGQQGTGFDPERFDAFPRLGATEVWQFRNTTQAPHPVHLHLVHFQVLDRDGAPAAAEERGWKDTVEVRAGETVRLAARFSGYTGRFVYHCHNLEHEDHDMMGQFRVVDAARLAGPGRMETAVAISAATFPDGAAVAYVVTGDAFPDALAGGPAAAADTAPVLLTAPSALPAATAAELTRLAPGRVVVLGGERAVADGVLADIARAVPAASVGRIFGPDRYATAAAVSAATFAAGAPVAYVATGRAFADALAGGAAAAARGGPVLLTEPDQVPGVTAAELRRLAPDRVVVLGGPAAIGEDVMRGVAAAVGPTAAVVRLAGASRYDTAVTVSRDTFPDGAPAAVVATGAGFADALAGVSAAAAAAAPLLLVDPAGVPPAVAAEIGRLGARRLIVLGGPAAVPEPLVDALAPLLAE